MWRNCEETLQRGGYSWRQGITFAVFYMFPSYFPVYFTYHWFPGWLHVSLICLSHNLSTPSCYLYISLFFMDVPSSFLLLLSSPVHLLSSHFSCFVNLRLLSSHLPPLFSLLALQSLHIHIRSITWPLLLDRLSLLPPTPTPLFSPCLLWFLFFVPCTSE